MQNLLECLSNSELLDLNSSILSKIETITEHDVLVLQSIAEEFKRRDANMFTLKEFVDARQRLLAEAQQLFELL